MTFSDVTPNLVVSNLERSLEFYRDVLGFTLVTSVPAEPPFVFAWMQRDTVSVFLNSEASAEMPAVPGTNMLFITLTAPDRESGVDRLFADVRGRVQVVMPLTDQFYGMREFSVKDPDGYVIIFAQRI
jgi:uncharacterized glyoxalase superfamily protein PhnB